MPHRVLASASECRLVSSFRVSLKALVLKKGPRLGKGMYFVSGCAGGEKADCGMLAIRKYALRGRMRTLECSKCSPTETG